MILQNDEASRNFGQMSKDTFDCSDFRSVFFSHYGLPHPTEFRLNFRVKYEVRDQIDFLSSSIRIVVNQKSLPTILNRAPKTLNLQADETELRLPFPLLDISRSDSEGCAIAPNVLVSSYPKFGKLSSEDDDFGAMQPCDKFFKSEVFYNRRRISGDQFFEAYEEVTDYIPFILISEDVHYVAMPVKVHPKVTDIDTRHNLRTSLLSSPMVIFNKLQKWQF